MTEARPADVADARRLLRSAARILAEVGVPPEVLLEDVRAGVDDAVAAHGRSGR